MNAALFVGLVVQFELVMGNSKGRTLLATALAVVLTGCGEADSCWGLLPGNDYTFVLEDGPHPGSLGMQCNASDLSVGDAVVFHVDSDSEDPVAECRVPLGSLVSQLPGITRIAASVPVATAHGAERSFALQVFESVEVDGCRRAGVLLHSGDAATMRLVLIDRTTLQ